MDQETDENHISTKSIISRVIYNNSSNIYDHNRKKSFQTNNLRLGHTDENPFKYHQSSYEKSQKVKARFDDNLLRLLFVYLSRERLLKRKTQLEEQGYLDSQLQYTSEMSLQFQTPNQNDAKIISIIEKELPRSKKAAPLLDQFKMRRFKKEDFQKECERVFHSTAASVEPFFNPPINRISFFKISKNLLNFRPFTNDYLSYNIWSNEEKRHFAELINLYPKDFSTISRELKTKNFRECILYYYRNKKTNEFKLHRQRINHKAGRPRLKNHESRLDQPSSVNKPSTSPVNKINDRTTIRKLASPENISPDIIPSLPPPLQPLSKSTIVIDESPVLLPQTDHQTPPDRVLPEFSSYSQLEQEIALFLLSLKDRQINF